MTEKIEFDAAVKTILSGDIKMGCNMLTKLYDSTENDDLKLYIANYLIPNLNPVDNSNLILILCEDILSICEKLNRIDLKGQIFVHKSQALLFELTKLYYKKGNLKLAPKFKGFALEKDETQYNKIVLAIDSLEKEVQESLEYAKMIAAEINDLTVKARINLSLGIAYGSLWNNYKLDHINKNFWLPSSLSKSTFIFSKLASFFLHKGPDRKQLRLFEKNIKDFFLKAATISLSINDKVTEAYAYYNWCLHLKSTNQFLNATYYLNKAEKIALEIGEHKLLNQIKEVKEGIKLKNRNIPDYVGIN